MVTSGFEVVQTVSKVEWKSATTMHGALCVMTPGAHLMQEWYADNLDMLQQVHIQLCVHSDSDEHMKLQIHLLIYLTCMHLRCNSTCEMMSYVCEQEFFLTQWV